MRRSPLARIGGLLAAVLLSQAAVATQGGDAGAYKVQDLYDTCSVAPDAAAYDAGTYACLAFIGGAVQYHDAVSDRKHLKRLICYPEGATVTDGRAAFLAWAEKNRSNGERMNELAVVGLVRALAERFPCR
jgi:hypothetical protein